MLTLFKNAGYETPGYEKVRIRNVWIPSYQLLDCSLDMLVCYVRPHTCFRVTRAVIYIFELYVLCQEVLTLDLG